MMRSQNSGHVGRVRSGWTLLELVVATSILALLLALLIPAVMSVRESSRRLQCAENQRQFGVALHGYESAHGRLPAMVRQSGVLSETGTPFSRHLYSPHVYLLPHLEQTALFEQIDLGREWGSVVDPEQVPDAVRNAPFVFNCPSDSGPNANNYRFCTGPMPLWRDSDRWLGGGGAFSRLVGNKVAQFRDGMSHTVLLSERRKSDVDSQHFDEGDFWFANVPPSHYPIAADDMRHICGSLSATPDQFAAHAGHVWLTSDYGNTLYNHVTTPNGPEPDCTAGNDGVASVGSFKASSRHADGVNALFGDGAVRFVASTIDLQVWRAFATRDGGDLVE